MNALLVTSIVLLSVTLIILVAAVILYIRQLGRAVEEIKTATSAIREEIGPLSESMRQTLAEVDMLARSARGSIGGISRLIESVDSWVEGRAVVEVAGKAVSSSKATVVSVVEGLKEGFRTLTRPRQEKKEEDLNAEQQ